MGARQFTGSNARVAYKPEKDGGILNFKPTANETVTTAAMNPDAASVTIAAQVTIAKGDIIAIGTDLNQEILEVGKVTAGTKTIEFEAATKPNFRHEVGEPVKKIESIDGWYQLGDVTTFTPRSARALDQSQAFGSGVRAIGNAIQGRYEFGADVGVEVDIEVLPLWFLHALNNNYTSVGTPVAPAVETKVAEATAAAASSMKLGSVANLAVGDFLEIDGKEVVKISKLADPAVEFADSNPLGLRYAHAKDVVVKKVTGPFTHTITKGLTLPVGISLLLELSEGDQKSLALLTGCRVGLLSLTASGSETISTVTLNISCARVQVLGKNIFGDAKKIAHRLYAQWEMAVTSGDADNRFNSLSLEIQNNLAAGEPLGTALPGLPTPGEGAVTGSFEYEYRTQAFSIATATGGQRKLVFKWTSIRDDNHSLQIEIPAAKFGGSAHPAVTDKGPIADTKEFTATLDSETNTDIKIVAKTNNPSVEYLTEG